MLLLLSLHNSSNPSLQLQTVQQQGRQSRPVLGYKRLRPFPLSVRWERNPPDLPGPTPWDPNSQQPGFPLNLLPGVEADSIFLPQSTTATLKFHSLIDLMIDLNTARNNLYSRRSNFSHGNHFWQHRNIFSHGDKNPLQKAQKYLFSWW